MKINNDIIIKDDENESVLRVHSEDVTFPLSPEDENLIKSLYKYVDDSGNEEIAKAENRAELLTVFPVCRLAKRDSPNPFTGSGKTTS